MDDKERARAELLNMKNLTEYYFNWHHDGGAMVILVNYEWYCLFEVPIYGGKPQFDKTYHKSEIDQLIEKGFSWT